MRSITAVVLVCLVSGCGGGRALPSTRKCRTIQPLARGRTYARIAHQMGNLVGIGLLFLCALSVWSTPAKGQKTRTVQDQLAPPLSGGSWRKDLVVPASPDPAISYHWTHPPKDDAEMQLLTREPSEVLAQPASAFTRLHAMSPIEFTVQGAGSLRFDFGTECAGSLIFDTDGQLSPGVTVSISEYNSPEKVNGGPTHPEKTVQPVRQNGSWVAVFNTEGYEGIRFAWINVNQNPATPWKIRNPRLNCMVKPVVYRGSFHSSDALLDSIWYTGAYTARLNMQSHGLSALLIDRGDRISWTGDAYVTQRAVLGAFGSADLVKANLQQNASSPSNGIEPYALLWVQSVSDWFMYTGDIKALGPLVPIAINKLEHAMTIWNDPDIAFYGHDERLGFLQTPPANLPEEKAAYRLLFVRVTANFARVLESAGYLAEARSLEATTRDYEQRFMENSPDPLGKLGVHAAAEAFLARVASTGDRERLYNREFTNKAERLSFSPFNEYTLIDAMSLQGHSLEALDDVRSLWGAQVRYGATCFAEVFRPSWAEDIPHNGRIPNGVAGYTSLCHGWSSGVVPWIQQNVLGIRATSPGFNTFDVEPLISSYLSTFSGAVPTPHGAVYVSWNASRRLLNARWPRGLHPRFILPGGVLVHGNVRIERDASESETVDQGKAVYHVSALSDTQMFVHLGPPPTTSVQNSPSGRALNEWKTVLTISSHQPQGKWMGEVGRDGYEMFGVKDGGIKLPSYVLAASHRSPDEVVWADCTEDVRALEQEHSSCKKLGALATRQPDWDKLTESIDVELAGADEHKITMYFADWENEDRELEISIYDLSRLTELARPMILRHFGNGVYISFVAVKSFRIRVAHVNGGNAVISALFFDSVSSP